MTDSFKNPDHDAGPRWQPEYPADLPGIWQFRTGLPLLGLSVVLPLIILLGILILVPGRVATSFAEMDAVQLVLLVLFVGGTYTGVYRRVAIEVVAWPCMAFLVGFFGPGKPWLATYFLLTLPAILAFLGRKHAPVPKYLKSNWVLTRERFTYSTLAQVGFLGIVLLYCLTFLAPYLSPYPPNKHLDIENLRLLQPFVEGHLLGTDDYSRDILSRIIHGAWISMTIGIFAVSLSVSIGLMAGLLAGYVGGWTDWFIMRLVDFLLSLPRLVLLLVILAVLIASWPKDVPTEYRIHVIIAILAATGWMGTARLVRGEVLSVKERDFVQAGRALGLSQIRILMGHVAPNCLAPVIVSATLGVGGTILVEAGLSFLGLGVPPPTATWGAMVNEGREFLIDAPWITFFPGITIVIAVTCFNLVGDGLRDAMDPRLASAGRPPKGGRRNVAPDEAPDEGEAENEAA